jgi:DNA (cytosine-5)-methyltransferase 1
MQTLHLFAGAGGGLLADLILGHTPIGAVEFDPYCCRVLRERAADGWFPSLRVHEGDVRLFDPSDYTGRVDCLHAGFPCQPHSVAGKREGEADERNLWPDTARIIGQLRPRFALLENVPGIVSNGYAAVVIGELSALGYDCRWAIISAADAGAPHRRDRWWCLAERTDADGCGRRQTQSITEWREQRQKSCLHGESIPNSIGNGLERITEPGESKSKTTGIIKGSSVTGAHFCNTTTGNWWKTEPGVGRVVDGLAARVDRLKALGNGQVSITAALAWRILGGP